MSFSDRVLSIFPPPQALRMLHSGVSITDEGVYVVTLRPTHGKSHKNLSLASYGFYPFAEKAVLQGVIEDPAHVVSVLTKAAQEHTIKFAASTIPDEKAYVFKTSLSIVPGMHISDAVALKIQETVPIAMQYALYDYSVVGKAHDRVDVVVRVVHEKVSRAYFSVFSGSGILPLLFKVESQSIADAIIPEGAVEPSILVHVSNARTLFAILHEKTVHFSTSIDYGLTVWKQCVMKELSVDEHAASILISGGVVEGITHEQGIIALANTLSVVRDEVKKLEEYWKSRGEHDVPVSSVHFSGAPAAMVGLNKYLSDSFDIPVHAANVWTNTFSLDEYIPKLQYADSLSYAAAVGAALPHALHW